LWAASSNVLQRVSVFVYYRHSLIGASYDLDYPVECDDEFWEPADPSLAFKQPPGKPSVMTHVVMYMKLIEIIGMAQQTIVS
jgi:hypothetical protein